MVEMAVGDENGRNAVEQVLALFRREQRVAVEPRIDQQHLPAISSRMLACPSHVYFMKKPSPTLVGRAYPGKAVQRKADPRGRRLPVSDVSAR
jgi:hypothetical protein